MAYAVLRCAHAQAQDTQVTVSLNFLFLVAKGSLSPFWSDRTNYQLLTRERAGSPGACHQVVYLHAKRTLFPCSLQVRSTWKVAKEIVMSREQRS